MQMGGVAMKGGCGHRRGLPQSAGLVLSLWAQVGGGTQLGSPPTIPWGKGMARTLEPLPGCRGG